MQPSHHEWRTGLLLDYFASSAASLTSASFEIAISCTVPCSVESFCAQGQPPRRLAREDPASLHLGTLVLLDFPLMFQSILLPRRHLIDDPRSASRPGKTRLLITTATLVCAHPQVQLVDAPAPDEVRLDPTFQVKNASSVWAIDDHVSPVARRADRCQRPGDLGNYKKDPGSHGPRS